MLSKLGFEILIGGEHHLIEQENPYAIIVSNQIGNIDNRHGSGGLVTWHMCRHVDRDLVKDLISYVAISLIGDSMDMTTEENYTFTKWGKEKIHPNLVPFVEALNRDGDTISCRSYSYGIITCINSLIRLGTIEDKQELFSALCGEIDPSSIIDKCKKYHTSTFLNKYTLFLVATLIIVSYSLTLSTQLVLNILPLLSAHSKQQHGLFSRLFFICS